MENEKKSELPEKLQDLMNWILDIKMMNKLVQQVGYDVHKLPFGKFSGPTIRKGCEILKEISDAIEKKRSKGVLIQYSADFYSIIPHDFGSQ